MEPPISTSQSRHFISHEEPLETTAGSSDLDIKDIMAMFRRRRKFIAITFTTIFVLTVILTLCTTPIYQARAKLLIASSGKTFGSGNNDEVPLMEYYMSWDASRNQETQIEIMKSRPVMEDVAKKLNLKERLLDAKSLRAVKGDVDTFMAKIVAGSIGVESKRNADIIILKAQWSDPELARDLANMTAELYIEESRKLNQEVAASARRFVEEQLTISKLDLDKAERVVRRFKERTGITDLKAEINEKVRQAAEVEAQAIKTEADLRNARAKLAEIQDQVRKNDPTLVSATTISNNPVVLEQQKRLSELQVKRAGLLEEFGVKHPDVISVENQIANLKRSIGQSMTNIVSSRVKTANPIYQKLYNDYADVQAQVFGLEATLSAFTNVMESNRRELATLPRKEQDLANLERGREVATKTYMMLLEKYQNLRIAEVSRLGNARIIETAETPTAPVKPRKKQNIAIGALLGLFIGCFGALGLEYLDDTVKTQEDLEEIAHKPTLGTIPLLKPDELQNLYSPEGGIPAVTDGFRMIRSNVRFFALDRPMNTLMVTSAIPGEGKTTTAVNLAAASAQGDRKVLLIDGDLRNSSIHKLFKLTRTPGLTNVLAEDLDFEAAIQHTPIHNLDIMSGGSTSPNPVELLESAKMMKLLEELQKRYDHIIIDTPPVGILPDAIMLGSAVDGVLLIISSGITPKPQLLKTIRILTYSKARVLGTILNKIDYKKHGYGDYHYYSYNYSYGSGGEKGKAGDVKTKKIKK